MLRLSMIAWVLLMIFSSGYGQKKREIVERLDGVQPELEKVLKTWNGAGFSVAVVSDEGLIWSTGVGFRDVENRLPATGNTQYAIGSCSKAFTTALLGILEEDGKVQLNNSPRDYIPGIKFSTNELNSLVTIRDMMSHRTGLPRHDYSWYWFPSDSRDSLIYRLRYQQPFADVREKWYYNNFMYLAQGVIAEKVTGKTWEENITERFFQPLGMTHSTLDIEGMIASNEPAFGYQTSDGKIIKMDYYHIRAMSPAGSINSSVNEMAHWVATWINKGKHGETQLIPEAFVKEAISSQMVVNAGLPTDEYPDVHLANYGFGWFLSSYRGHYRVEHGGNINGFSASTSFYPQDKLGIVVLANQNGSRIPTVVRNLISDRIMGLETIDWNKQLRKSWEKQQKENAKKKKEEAKKELPSGIPSHGLPAFVGAFNHPGYGTIRISESGGTLFAAMPLYTYQLKPIRFYSFDVFQLDKDGNVDVSGDGELTFNFLTNTDGEIYAIETKIEAALPALMFTRLKE